MGGSVQAGGVGQSSGGVSPAGGGGGSVQPGGWVSPAGGSVQPGGWVSPAGGGQSSRGGSVQPGGGQSVGGWGGSGQSANRGEGSAKIGQQNEYSLHSAQYASCVHVGGLSCSTIVFTPSESILSTLSRLDRSVR